MAWDWDKLQQQKKGNQGGGAPPQMDEVVEKIKELKGKFPGSWIIIVIIVLIFIGWSMVYTVGVDEVGIVQRFGKYSRTTSPGLNFKLPALIEKVIGRHMEVFKTKDGTIVPAEFFIHFVGVVYNKGYIDKFQLIQEDYDRIIID